MRTLGIMGIWSSTPPLNAKLYLLTSLTGDEKPFPKLFSPVSTTQNKVSQAGSPCHTLWAENRNQGYKMVSCGSRLS